MNAISTAIAGMYGATVRFDRASHEITKSFSANNDGNGDPARAIVDQIQAEYAFRANVATFKTASRMQKTLLDILV